MQQQVGASRRDLARFPTHSHIQDVGITKTSLDDNPRGFLPFPLIIPASSSSSSQASPKDRVSTLGMMKGKGARGPRLTFL